MCIIFFEYNYYKIEEVFLRWKSAPLIHMTIFKLDTPTYPMVGDGSIYGQLYYLPFGQKTNKIIKDIRKFLMLSRTSEMN